MASRRAKNLWTVRDAVNVGFNMSASKAGSVVSTSYTGTVMGNGAPSMDHRISCSSCSKVRYNHDYVRSESLTCSPRSRLLEFDISVVHVPLHQYPTTSYAIVLILFTSYSEFLFSVQNVKGIPIWFMTQSMPSSSFLVLSIVHWRIATLFSRYCKEPSLSIHRW